MVTSTGSVPRCTRSTRPVVRSATSAVRESGSTATAETGARQVATTCRSGSLQPTGSAVADGSESCGDPCGSPDGPGSGTSGGPPSSPAPSTFSRQSRGPASGNVAQPASARTSATPATARHTRPIIGSTLEPGG